MYIEKMVRKVVAPVGKKREITGKNHPGGGITQIISRRSRAFFKHRLLAYSL
jgi:hypothetical protein